MSSVPMHKNYAAVNRPKREEAKAKELSDLRRENHELRRTVKRLAKEVNKRVGSQDDAVEVEITSDEPIQIVASICDCGTKPVEIVLNSKTWHVCPECKARKKHDV